MLAFIVPALGLEMPAALLIDRAGHRDHVHVAEGDDVLAEHLLRIAAAHAATAHDGDVQPRARRPMAASTQDVRRDDGRKAVRQDGRAQGKLAGIGDEFTA